MKLRHLFPFAAVAALSACADAQIEQPPIAYNATRALHERGTTTFTFRAFSKESGSRKEISGVPCKLQGQGFNSAFTTPAVVIAPEIGAKAQVASVTCSYNEEAKTKVLEPYNKTVADINANANAAAVNHGLLGALVGSIAAGVQTSRRDPSKDIYAYHSSSVVFADN